MEVSYTDNLYIIMPAFNEEMNIEAVVKEWHEVVNKIGGDSRLVIIDGGSRDQTFTKLCELKTIYPMLDPIQKVGMGHGATVLWGYQNALDRGADFIFQTDSDGQTLPSEFWQFWEQRNSYAAIIGHRNHREDGFSRVIVTKTLKLVLKLIFGLMITDANTPFRLIRRESMRKYITRIPVGFNLSNVILTVLLIQANENVKFIPITFRPRQGGVNSVNFKRIIKIGWQALIDFRVIKKELNRNR